LIRALAVTLMFTWQVAESAAAAVQPQSCSDTGSSVFSLTEDDERLGTFFFALLLAIAFLVGYFLQTRHITWFPEAGAFLIIGVIAAVRHILTVGASMTLAYGKTQAEFDRAIVELGVSSAIVVALVFAIFLSKASNSFPAANSKRSKAVETN
jgi:hypothetical protein